MDCRSILLCVDRIGTINPPLQFLEHQLLIRNSLEGKEHDTNSSQVDSEIILLVLTVLPGITVAVNFNPLLQVR